MNSDAALQLAILACLLAGAGAAAGMLAGLFGIGGGTVIVPVLYEVFGFFQVPDDVLMPLSIGTSLAVIVPTSFSSFWTHQQHGAVDMHVLRAWAFPIIFGVALGSFIARFASAATFQVVFVLIAMLTVARLLWSDSFPQLGSRLPRGRPLVGYGVAIGLSAALMGVGGGILSNLVMTLHGRSIHEGVATSSGVGVFVSVAGTLGYMMAGWDKIGLPPLSIGFVSVLGAVLLIPTSLIAASFGAQLAHLLPKKTLELAFAAYLAVISARFAVKLVWA
jgi:uncharacterized membrane protein YfcA